MEGLDLRELYAGGKLDSSGTFTLDADRLRAKLGQFQLKKAELAVLRFLAAAVKSGATRFSFQKQKRGYVCSWDAPLPAEELDRISELAIGVHSVQAHRGQVKLSSSAEEGTRLEVRFPWSFFGRKERQVLQGRGHLAPLQVEGYERHVAFPPAVRLVQLGPEPPAMIPLPRARVWPWEGRGRGYFRLLTASAELDCLRFVVDGVHFFCGPSPVPGVEICWWTDELNLDLGREYVVDDENSQQLTRALAAEALEVLLQAFEPGQAVPRALEWLAAQSCGPLEERLRHVPLFARADGTYATPEQLRAQFVRQGYLGVSSDPYRSSSAWAPGDVLMDYRPLKAVTEHFPHRLNMTHLADIERPPRLPPKEPYLTRIPMSHAAGELGLRRGSHESVLRRTPGDGEWTVQKDSFTPIDAAGGNESFKPALPHLYQALLHQQHAPEDASLVACYLLDCIAAFPANVQAREALRVPTRDGRLLSLSEACHARFFGLAVPTAPDDVLLLSERAGRVLQGLYGGGPRSYRSFLGSTRLAEAALLDCKTAADLLSRLWDLPASAAGQYLRSLSKVGRPKLPAQPISDVVQLAREMAQHSWIGVLSTDNLLRALLALQSPPGKKLLDVRGLELLLELDQDYADRPWFELHIMRARAYVSRRERPAAARECRAAAQLAPDSPQPYYLLANAYDLDGDVETALKALAEMKRRSHDDLMGGACAGMYVDVLLRAGRLAAMGLHESGAFRHPSQSGSRHALLARVALARGRPEEALSHCAHAAGVDVHETRALALEAQGHPREAASSYRQFLKEARTYGLFSTDAEFRLERARQGSA